MLAAAAVTATAAAASRRVCGDLRFKCCVQVSKFGLRGARQSPAVGCQSHLPLRRLDRATAPREVEAADLSFLAGQLALDVDDGQHIVEHITLQLAVRL